MKIKTKTASTMTWLLVVLVTLAGATTRAQRERADRDQREAASNFQANRLLKKGEDLLNAGEDTRGVRMLETVIEQYPDSFERYKAYLALGKHYLDKHREAEAITHFSRLEELKQVGEDEELTDETLDLYLEGLYMTGIAYYRTKQYGAAFPVLRKITRSYPNTVWANQSFYYIGMCHFEQENWNKAIEALQLVGTFVDTDSANVEFMEAGQRMYVKVQDTDLPILIKLGKTIDVDIETSAGDRETITCVPLGRNGETVIGSVPTEIGLPNDDQIGDNILQVRGGDTISATYMDENTEEGEHNVPRLSETRVVSTGSLRYTLGTNEGQADAAFIGQPLFLFLHDADLDVSPNADSATVTLISRYQKRDDEDDGDDDIDLDSLLAGTEEEEEWIIRDKVTLRLSEAGEKPVHTGNFIGSVDLITSPGNENADQTDNRLECMIDDQILAQYTDELHLGGEHSETRTATIQVVGEFDNSPRPTQNVVPDAMVKARKNLVEGSAFLELTKIFRDMGLMDGAEEKGEQGLERLDEVIKLSEYIPKSLVETAYQRKWQTQMAVGNYAAALNTCHTFNRLFPDSPLVDEALMEVAKIRMENGEYAEAKEVFNRILDLENSMVKAEAMFRIGECTEAMNQDSEDKNKAMAAAMPIYKRCSTSYPDSEYAGPALAKQVDYYFRRSDLVQADELLEQIFVDYPDADFLDSMLIKWVLVSYRMGDFQKAYDKAQQLVFEYPDSSYAQKAKEFLPKLKAKVGAA
ncbi:MAG: tetratricopeptide repeat protein, partial [Verrucomicrobiota bacterium]